MPDYSSYHFCFFQLYYFIAAAKNLNFSKAAAECHVVPNVISKQIAKLESVLNTNLFNRVGKRVELTEQGKIFYRCARNITERFDIATERITKYDSSENMHLQIGYYDLWSEQYISPIVRDFKKAYPQAQMSVKYIDISQTLSSLRNGIADAVLMSPYKECMADDIDSVELATSPIGVVVSSFSPLSERTSIDASELYGKGMQNTVVYSAGMSTVKDSLKVSDEVMVYMDKYYALGLDQGKNIHNIFVNIRAGDGLSFIPTVCSDYIETLNLKCIPLTGSDRTASLHLMWSKANTNSALASLIEKVRENRDVYFAKKGGEE